MVAWTVRGPKGCTMKKTVEELMDLEYWIIDILPERVPEGGAGQYFAVERFLIQEQGRAIKQKHLDLILKLNCYMNISLDDAPRVNPSPEEIAEAVFGRHVNILLGGAMITSDPDDTYLTLYGPDEKLLDLVRALAASEGLFVWQ